MLIVKQEKNEAFVHRVDAVSRVAVWAANHANSPLISKLGLTHVSGGAADLSGRKILHGIWPGLTLERHDAIMPLGQLPHQHGMIPNTALAPLQMGYDLAPLAISQFFSAPPCNIPQIISEMTGGYDPVYVATKLGLFQRDMDKVSGPKLCRYLCPPLRYDELFDMLCYDADGNLQARYELSWGLLFEVKHFKFCDSPEYGKLYFAPRESSVYVPLYCNGIFSTNPRIAIGNLNTGLIITAGGVEVLDWAIIRRCCETASIIWANYLDDPLLSRDNFAEVFAIVTEAKRHGIEMKILKATAREMTIGDSWEAEEELLPDQTVKMQARQYGIKIDPVWNGLPGEIDFDDEPPVREVPPFWNGNGFAEFYGKKADELMLEFFEPRIKPWIPIGRIWLIIDKQDKQLARKARSTKKSHVRVATFEIFDDPERLQNEIRTETDLMFIVLPENGIPTGILDKCADIGVPVGVFSRKEDQNSLLDGYDATAFVVKKNTDLEKVFYIKNMKNRKIEKFKFFPSGVEETTGTEEDMRQGE